MRHKTQNGWTKARMIQQIQTHMLDHRSVSGFNDNLCVYRATDGNKCAVGCFIPDDKYRPDFDGDANGIVRVVRSLRKVMPLQMIGLREMQQKHDLARGSDPRPIVIKWIEENVEDQ